MLVGRPNPPPPSCEWDSFGTASFVYLADPSFVLVDRGGFANVSAVAVLCLQVKFWSVKLPNHCRNFGPFHAGLWHLTRIRGRSSTSPRRIDLKLDTILI